MKVVAETIVDDNSIQINVDYEYEQSESQLEFGHGIHDVGLLMETNLISVSVIIKGIKVDILSFLNKKQRDFIIDKLTYEK